MQTIDRSRHIPRRVLSAALATTGMMAIAVSAHADPALPSGGEVRSGVASIGAPGGGAMVITQSSPTAIIGWDRFSIGSGGAVTFANGNGATLNRVTGADASLLDGHLSATGSVYLINPNGVVIGRSGVVNVGGGFVASTLDPGDAAFASGGTMTFQGPSRAAVVNLGRVSALGGDVALIAATVRNEGSISAPLGTAALAAGSAVLMRDAALDGGRIAVLVGDASSSASNAGALTAATVELRAAGGSVYALAGNMAGIVRATGVREQGGRIFLTADRVTVAPGAVLDASGASGGGTIAAMAGDTLRFAGTARAAGGTGAGGTVETSGASVDFAGATVDTSGVTTGLWLVDPVDLTVDAAAASTINRNLATTDVTLQTTASGSSGPGIATPGLGDITIAAPLAWSSANRLTLDAYHAIRINSDLSIGGAGKLTLSAATGASGVLLSFGVGRAVRFTGPANGGRALTINGQAYQLIDRFDQLAAINGAGLGGYYALAGALSAAGRIYPGAVLAGGGAPFSGTLEGLGNSIRGLVISAPGVSRVGLIGTLTGTVRDLSLIGGTITGGSYTGAIAGFVGVPGLASSVVTNVSSDLAVRGDAGASALYSVGGLIGHLEYGVVTGATGRGAVRGGDSTGGVIGDADTAQLSDLHAFGGVTGTIQRRRRDRSDGFHRP